jgi:hypothetical protein
MKAVGVLRAWMRVTTMKTRIRHHFVALLVTLCSAGFLSAQPSEIVEEMKTIAASLEEANSHLKDAADVPLAVQDLRKVADASDRAQKLEPSSVAKAEGAEKERAAEHYRLTLQLMIDVVKAAGTAAELKQPQLALDLLKALDPMTAPAHSQPFK